MPTVMNFLGYSLLILLTIYLEASVLSNLGLYKHLFSPDSTTYNFSKLLNYLCACTGLLLMLKSERKHSSKHSYYLLVRKICPIGTVIAIALSLNYMVLKIQAVSLLGYAILSFIIAIMFVCTLKMLCDLNIGAVVLVATLACTLRAFAIPSTYLLGPEFNALAIIVTPILYGAVYRFLNKEDSITIASPNTGQRHANSSSSVFKEVPIVLFLTILVVGFTMTLVSATPAQHQTNIQNLLLIQTIPLIIGSILTLLVFLTQKFNYNTLFYIVIIPMLSLSVLLIAISGPEYTSVAKSLSNMARNITYIGFFTLCVYLAKYSQISLASATCWGLLGFYTGRALAIAGSMFLNFEQSAVIAEIYAGCAFIALWLCILLFSRNNMKNGWGMARINDSIFSQNPYERSCDVVAKRASLTPREREVLGLLSQGLGMKKIAEKLVISENTSRMHIKRIYSKLDIHKKEELYAIVEETRKNL